MNFRNLLFAGCALAMCAAAATAQVPSYVPTNGLVGWWPFNGNANDESGNGNNGVVNGATLTEDRNGVVNAAYSFDGVSNFIDVGNPVSMQNVTESYTQSGWAYYYDYSIGNNGYTFISKRQDNSGNDWATAITRSDGSIIFFADDAYYTQAIWAQTNPLSLNQWHFLTFVKSFESYSIYIDGSLVSSVVDSHVMDGSTNNLIIGAQLAWPEYMKGSLDDIGIWNRALTDQEIQGLYIGCAVLPTTIAGELEPVTLSASSYACNNNAGSTYAWSVTNGVITSGQGTANVSVLWGEEGAGSLTVVETNAEGCSGTAVTIDVNVVCAISLTAINGPLGPNELTATTYICDGAGTSTYQWTITNGVISAGQGTSTVTVLWASTGLGSLSVQETTQANCTSDVISIDVVVIPTSISEETEAVLAVYPNPVQNEINIRSTLQAIGNNYTLFDGAGKLVRNGNINSTLTSIHASTLAAGTYVLRVGETFEQTIQVVR